jgi:hypothetical protein
MRPTVVLSVVPLFASLVIAYGCSDDLATPAASDAGIGDAALDRKAPPTEPEDSAVPVACEPQSTTGFAPTWAAPTGMHQNKCTPEQMETFADCAYGHTGYDQAKCTAFNAAQANAECIACAAPTGSKSGAVVTTGGATNVNYAGCVALFTGELTAEGCGAKIQAAEQCRAASCDEVCPVIGGDNEQYTAYAKCLEKAWKITCDAFASATSCAADLIKGTGVAAPCYPNTTDFGVRVRPYVDLFCGAPPGDGGTDAATDG